MFHLTHQMSLKPLSIVSDVWIISSDSYYQIVILCTFRLLRDSKTDLHGRNASVLTTWPFAVSNVHSWCIQFLTTLLTQTVPYFYTQRYSTDIFMRSKQVKIEFLYTRIWIMDLTSWLTYANNLTFLIFQRCHEFTLLCCKEQCVIFLPFEELFASGYISVFFFFF